MSEKIKCPIGKQIHDCIVVDKHEEYVYLKSVENGHYKHVTDCCYEHMKLLSNPKNNVYFIFNGKVAILRFHSFTKANVIAKFVLGGHGTIEFHYDKWWYMVQNSVHLDDYIKHYLNQ